MTATKLFSALALVALSACVPIPNMRYFAPEVSGQVLRNGVPVEGAEISLNASFADALSTTKTDAGGRFKVGPLKQLFLMATLIGDPLFAYGLKLKINSVEYEGFSYGAVGNPTDPVYVICNMDQPRKQGSLVSYCSHNLTP